MERFEHHEETDKVDKFLDRIKEFKDKIAAKMGISDEKLTAVADEALVDAARETISDADADGQRTESESSDINDAVSSVLVQGAMEKAGYDQSSGENPILSLDTEETETELIASIAALHEEEVTLPTGEDVAELAAQTIEDAKWDRVIKVDRAHGTNPGGWYEYPSTGERYYVKFYEDPNQGRTEYIANEVYARLGIKAVSSELAVIDGQEAVASSEIPGADVAYIEEQKKNPDVQMGFVADAFLANWDVVGAVHDNIARASDGGLYRIDNGGSLIYRAQGRLKEYSPNSIPELDSMRNPNYSAGKVFEDITQKEIIEQAQSLLDNLSEDDIREIVEQSGLEGSTHDMVLDGMLGRRRYLEQLCAEAAQNDSSEDETSIAERREVVSDGRLAQKLSELRELGPKQIGDFVVFRRSEITCDHDHIEGQKLNIYDKSPAGRVEISFKLRNSEEQLHRKLYDKFVHQDETYRYDAISDWHINKAGEAEPYALCEAISFSRGDVKVYIANPDTQVRTAHGMVKIVAPSEMPSEDIEKAVADIMENDIGITGALNEVSDEYEDKYKQARYGWEHRIYEMHAEDYEAAGRLESKEVAPGYSTLVEPGKHKEYEAKYGEARAYHVMYSDETDSIVSTLMNGLLCSSERYERGIYDDGMSTSKDLKSGGGDSVFTRISRRDHAEALMTATVIFKPELFDRTDWYSYDRDRYGSTEDDEYPQRLSPDELFGKLNDGTLLANTNEQMFRTGIGPDYIEEVRVNPAQCDEILVALREKGVSEIGGRPIEEIVVPNENYVASKRKDPSEIEDWDDSLDQEWVQKQEQSTQSKEGILNGTAEYPGMDGILDLCETQKDVYALFDAVSEHGHKDDLKNDLSMYIVNNISVGLINKYLGGPFDPLDANNILLRYAQEKLDVDLQNIIDIKQKWNK
ncbi:hypothetical protein IJM16_02845 [Candidatus Saccharibacteria bacterium]|nr:hypothetical protein [Candidatus Saccharibacteria bacterium]